MAGLHVPIIPLVEVVGSIGAAVPLQIGAMAVKAGVVLLFTVIVSVVALAHCPALGVKV